MKVCSKCNIIGGKLDRYCSECGGLLSEPILKEREAAGEVKKAGKVKTKKPFSIKAEYLLLFAAFVLFALFCSIVSISLSKSKPMVFSYIKDGEIYASRLESPSPERLTKSFANTGGDFPLVFDKNKIIYPDYSEGGFVSYFQKGSDTQLIDTEIKELHVMPDKALLYVRGGEKALVLNNLKGEAALLDKGVKDVKATASGEAYYVKNSALYSMKNGRLLDGIDSLISANDDGSFYFTRKETIKVPLYDYVNDDLEFSDRDMKEPLEEDYQKTALTLKGLQKRVNREEYNAALKLYEEKLKRDGLRQELKEGYNEYPVTSLYYMNKTKEIKLSAKYSACLAAAPELSRLLYTKKELPEGKTIKLSKIISADNVQRFLDSQNLQDNNVYLAMGDISEPVFDEKSKSYQFSPRGDIFYINSNDELIMYRNKDFEKISDDVSSYLLHSNGDVQYVSGSELFYLGEEKHSIDTGVSRILKNTYVNRLF